MAQSNVAVTAGSGTLLDTWTTSKGGNTVHAGRWVPGEYPDPTYALTANGVSVATVDSHIMQVMAGASNTVRIRRIWVAQSTAATSVGTSGVAVLRLTTAGTGGTAVTPAQFDTSDSAAGAAGRTLPSSKGTESTVLMHGKVGFANAQPTTTVNSWEWVQQPGTGPLVIPAGTSNGIALKLTTAIAAASVNVVIEFVETLYTK